MKNTNKKFKSLIFVIVSIIILSVSLFINPSTKLSDGGDNNFDWYSEGIVFADMLYNKRFEKGSEFLRIITPGMLIEKYGGAPSDYINSVKNEYILQTNNYTEADFKDYMSNIVIQRYFFRFIDGILNVSNSLKANLFYAINCLLLATMISIILLWISKILNNYSVSVIILAALSTCAPIFLMYGKNLYWCAWTMFFPTAMMALTLMSKPFRKSKHKILILSAVAFVTILIKCLFYFEFITVVLISMMIPVLFYLLNEEAPDFSLKKKIRMFIVVSLFALSAFLLANVIKFLLLADHYGSTAEAWSAITDNLYKRVLGDLNHENEAVVKSAQVSYISVIILMLLKPFLSVKHIASFSQFPLIVVTFVVSVIINYVAVKYNRDYKKKIMSWTACTWVSLLAPLSWMILAKPHCYVHNYHCSINWFNIFDIMAMALIIISVIYLFTDLYKHYESEKAHAIVQKRTDPSEQDGSSDN